MRPGPVIAAAALLLGSQLRPAEVDPLAGAAPYRRLFLDATVVERSANLRREFHAAERYSGNPVIRRDKPWEGWGPYVYGTVLWDAGRLRMWYQCIGKDAADVCYAESSDGIRWTKPDLGIIEYHGSPRNNIVGIGGVCHIPSVIRVPEPASPDRRWAMYGFAWDRSRPEWASGVAAVAYSADGLRWNWKRAPEQLGLFATSDVTSFFFDPIRNRYAATWKTMNRRHRAVGVALSADGAAWTKPVTSPVLGADDLDPDATQVYGMPAFAYQGLYIGLPWIYHARWIKYGRYASPEVMYEAQEGSARTVDVQLAWSHDLIQWTRTPERRPFLALGPDGAFDSKMVYTARAPVIVGDRLFFYYGGYDTIHDDDAHAKGAIGLATLRLDGFCSMAAGRKEGWVISRREVFNAPEVTINAKCGRGGYVAAEILDRNDRVIPGFSRRECVPFTGDSVRHTLRWKTATFPRALADKDRKVRFILRNADLYAYLPSAINARIDDGDHD
ncbi:MAG TPA: hypothetical protein VGM37_12730 [Armatimonadota bacterium]|jgi:hypothetical protein